MNWLRNRRGEGMPYVDRARPPGVAELNGFAVRPPAIPPDYVAPPRRGDPTQIIEPSEGWWTQAGAFGYRYQGLVPELADTVIPLTEQLRLPGPPRLWWIHWFRYSRSISTEASPDPGQWDIRGRVTYGVGGAQNIVEVDVASGIQMAVVCNSLKVDLLTYAPIVGVTSGNNETPIYSPGNVGLVAGAMFGDGSAGGALPASYSTPSYEVTDLGNLAMTVPVPDFARTLVLHTTVPNPATLANSTLAFSGPNTSKVVNLQTVYSQLITEKGIAIPASANQVTITTAAPCPPGEHFTLQFMLAL